MSFIIKSTWTAQTSAELAHQVILLYMKQTLRKQLPTMVKVLSKISQFWIQVRMTSNM